MLGFRLRQHGEAGARRVEAEFAQEAMVGRYIELFEELTVRRD